MDSKVYLSIVIPAYNEESRIASTLVLLQKFFEEKNIKFEVVVVDDGSSDLTSTVVLRLSETYPNIRLVSYPHNEGKGYAVKFGVANSRGELILMADADGSTPFGEFERLKSAIDENVDIAVGSRAISSPEVKLETTFLRKLFGRSFSFFVRLILQVPILDTQCGFKLFRAETARDIFSKTTIYGFGFDVEVLFLAYKKKYNVREVAINWSNVAGSKVNLIRDSFKMFLDLIKVRVNSIKGAYV